MGRLGKYRLHRLYRLYRKHMNELTKQPENTNSIKHGLLGKKAYLLPEESHYLFNKLNKNLIGHWKPENEAEKMLVDQLGFNYWRLKRGFRLETEIILAAKLNADSVRFGRKRLPVEMLNFDDFEKFTRYITSIQRQILRILHELERLQATRKGQNVPLPVVVDMDIGGNEV